MRARFRFVMAGALAALVCTLSGCALFDGPSDYPPRDAGAETTFVDATTQEQDAAITDSGTDAHPADALAATGADAAPQAKCKGLVNGDYCGSDRVDGEPNTLYTCTGGAVFNSQLCVFGCKTNSSNRNDACN